MFKSATVDRANAKSSNTSLFQKEKSNDAFIQPKLNIGKVNDKYEVEADHMADMVVNKQQTTPQSFFSPVTTLVQKQLEEDVQKQEETEDIQQKSLAKTITPVVQLEPSEEEVIQEKSFDTIQKQEEDIQLQGDEEIQPKEEDEVNVQAKIETPRNPIADISNRIRQGRGNGSPLSTPTQTMMESGFGADFSGVRIHTDSIAANMNRDFGARAFTNNNDIFFNEGQFNPQSRNGQTLLAHELTHTIQQGASTAIQYSDQNSEGTTLDALAENNLDTSSTLSAAESGSNSIVQNPTVLELPETSLDSILEEEIEIEEGQENLVATEDVMGVEEGEESVEAFPMFPQDDPAFNALENRVGKAADNQQTTNPAEQEAQAAQSAATVPSNERMGGAQANQVAIMAEQEPVEFDAEAFKAKLMERIESMQLPEDQEEATEFEDNNNIQEISDAASADASQAQENTAGPISEATATPPNVDTVPEREVIELPEAPIGQVPSSVSANTAMPNSRPESQVSQPLQENIQEVDQQMIDNEVTEEQLARSNEPEFASALDSRSEARANTETAPTQFREQETQSLNGSQQQAENTSEGTLEGMHGDRSNILNTVIGQQTETGTQNTTERERISNEINGIYEATKTDVETILEDLDTKVTEKFDKAASKAKLKFENYVEKEMDDYKDRRYSGLRGKGRWLVDKFKGLPDEVNQFFVDGRALYIAEMDTALTDISNYIGQRLTEAKNRIETGKQELTDYVEELPENLHSIGQEASEEIQDKFDQLTDDVNAKQDDLIDSLAQQYNDSLSEVDARIDEMKAANRGLIDMALDAINGVIETIRKLKQLISDLLSEIQSSLSIIMADPIGFVSNLFAGVKKGFDNFVTNIETHLIAGFVQWLTGALGPIGITIPEDLFSLKGIFSLVMQVLGLTWDYMRQKAVKLLGEPVVRAMEFGLEMFQIIREKGVEGIWEYIKEQFTDLKETIIDSIKNMLITQVIEAGIKWLVGLLIPGGGFIKAIMAIKDFIVFFVESALMLIPTLIEAIRAMASGNMSRVSVAMERGLALLVPLVIKLFARIIGLGGLVKKVQKIIKRIRRRIDRAINKLILKAKKAFRKLLRKGKAAVAGILEWWKKDKKFRDKNGEEHKLFFIGSGNNAKLDVASNPIPLDVLFERKKDEIREREVSEPQIRTDYNQAKDLYDEIKVTLRQLNAPNLSDEQERNLNDKLNSLFNDLSQKLINIGIGTSSEEELPETNVSTTSKSVLGKNVAGSVVAEPLTKKEGNMRGRRTRTGIDPEGWVGHIDTLPNFSNNYRRLHLLSEKLHGDGQNKQNITTGKPSENSLMEGQAETPAYNLMNADSILWYEAHITNYRSESGFEFFAEGIRIRYGLMERNENQEWKRIGQILYNNTFPVSKPDPAGASLGLPNLDTITLNYINITPGFPRRPLMRIIRVRPSGGYSSWIAFENGPKVLEEVAKPGNSDLINRIKNLVGTKISDF